MGSRHATGRTDGANLCPEFDDIPLVHQDPARVGVAYGVRSRLNHDAVAPPWRAAHRCHDARPRSTDGRRLGGSDVDAMVGRADPGYGMGAAPIGTRDGSIGRAGRNEGKQKGQEDHLDSLAPSQVTMVRRTRAGSIHSPRGPQNGSVSMWQSVLRTIQNAPFTGLHYQLGRFRFHEQPKNSSHIWCSPWSKRVVRPTRTVPERSVQHRSLSCSVLVGRVAQRIRVCW